MDVVQSEGNRNQIESLRRKMTTGDGNARIRAQHPRQVVSLVCFGRVKWNLGLIHYYQLFDLKKNFEINLNKHELKIQGLLFWATSQRILPSCLRRRGPIRISATGCHKTRMTVLISGNDLFQKSK